MAFLQSAPVVGRTAVKRLTRQLSPTSPSPLTFSAPAATAASPFLCRKCLHTAQTPKSRPSPSLLSRLNQTRVLRQFPNTASSFARCLSTSTSKKTTAAAPTFASKLNADSASPAGENAKANSKSFPETSSKSAAYWLLGSAASVFGIVVFGGLTRLTESGCVSLVLIPAVSQHCHPKRQLSARC